VGLGDVGRTGDVPHIPHLERLAKIDRILVAVFWESVEMHRIPAAGTASQCGRCNNMALPAIIAIDKLDKGAFLSWMSRAGLHDRRLQRECNCF